MGKCCIETCCGEALQGRVVKKFVRSVGKECCEGGVVENCCEKVL